ncbi:hypothetical protein QQM79_15465 [Marinobacteraceae bacterium S3BR75-40.1]
MRKLLHISNAALAGFVLALGLSILIAYPWANHFSMPVQIGAHIATLVLAVGIKVSYVARLTALKNLGLPVN